MPPVVARSPFPTEYQTKIAEIRGFVSPLLHFIPRSLPDYTDHGITHNEDLLRILDNFIENFPEYELSDEELFIIYASIWLHDVGCLICTQEDKAKHSLKSAELLDSDFFKPIHSIVSLDLITCIKYVILSHQHSYPFEKIPEKPIHPKIRLKLICSLFRLIDACDISAARVNQTLYNVLSEKKLIDEENKKWWDAHRDIVSVVFEKNNLVIYIEKENLTHLLIDHLEDDLKPINKVLKEYGYDTLQINKIKLEYGIEKDV
jgi:hypothetical protein